MAGAGFSAGIPVRTDQSSRRPDRTGIAHMPIATSPLNMLLVYAAAALFELLGSFAFWGWLRLHKPIWWALGGTLSLVLFVVLLTRIDTAFAGRAYAAYGGIYICASLVWLWCVEGETPDSADILGVGVSVAGALIILLGHYGQR